MLYESRSLPKTPLGVVSVPNPLAEVPPVDHHAIVEELRLALCVNPWTAEQTTLAGLLEDIAKSLDATSGDTAKVPKLTAQAVSDLCENLIWQFHARDTFFAVRSKLSEVLESQRP